MVQGTSDRAEGRPSSSAPKNGAPPSPLVVERLAHPDIPDICALFKRVWDAAKDVPPELSKPWQPTPLEFTSWMEGVTYFAARRDGRMIGSIGCEIEDGSCRLLNLVVDPEYRRQGVAAQLTTAAIEWAKHNACSALWVDALDRFTAAAALFRHLGFTECGVLHRHYLKEDVRLFERLL